MKPEFTVNEIEGAWVDGWTEADPGRTVPETIPPAREDAYVDKGVVNGEWLVYDNGHREPAPGYDYSDVAEDGYDAADEAADAEAGR